MRHGKYIGCGPLSLAKFTVKFEGKNDVEFLAVQDAVSLLSPVEVRMYRDAYREAMRAWINKERAKA
jgi:hypothetical protein